MIGKKLINTGAEAAFLPSQHFDTVTYTGNGGTQRIGGYINRGAAFINGYITTPFDRQNIVNLNDKTEDFSISLWVNIAAYGSSNVIFSIDSGAPSYQYIGLVTTSTGVNWVHYPGGANANTVVSSVNLNEWNHFACVRENSTMKLYKNGSLVGSDPITYANTGFGTAERIVIGKRTSVGDLPLNGKVDQFRVFNKALSSSELTTLYGETAASTSKSVTDIFDDNSGVALYQLDGNANDTGRGAIDSGQSAVFNGSSGEISNTVGATSTTSFSMWVKFNSTSPSQYIQVFDNNNYGIFVDTGKLNIQYASGSTSNGVAWTIANTTDWFHIAGTFTSSSSILYVNGVQKTESMSNWINAGNVPHIGNRADGTGPFNGKIDQVRIYSSSLSNSDVINLYNESSVPTANLVAHYKLDGNANDETGSYNGTATSITYSDPAEFPVYNGTPTNITYQKSTDFQPDLVWVKARTSPYSHNLQDSVRGGGQSTALNPNLTLAEGTYGIYGFIDTFDTNGFTVKTGSTGAEHTNSNGVNYVAWSWKAGGTAVSNTDGNVTTTVSANVDAGFSIVKYFGGNISNTYGHGLDLAPELIIIKNLDTVRDWSVVGTALGGDGGDRLVLNDTVAKITTTGLSGTTATTFAFEHNNSIANSAENFIAYCFHSVEGYSKIGSYTGTGAAGNAIVTGFEPAFLMIKSTSNAEPWFILDAERDILNPRDNRLMADSDAAETDGSVHTVDFTSNGFVANGTLGNGTNGSGVQYIYLAIAADPDVIQPVVENSFDVVTYTGNGTTQTINTDFKPDLVWLKSRSATTSNMIIDSIRGANEIIFSNLTNAETNSTVDFTSFNSNGFSVGSGGSVNANGGSFVAWCWKAGDHDDNLPQINTNGTIDSVVSANPASGFSIVKHTASTGSWTVGHGLSQAPEIVFYKNLNISNAWAVWVTGFTDKDTLYLNTTAAKTTAGFTLHGSVPTSTTIGTSSWLANSGDNVIAYCFHSVSGYQKIGSYDGGTITSSNIVNLGFRPRFVLLKPTQTANDWIIYDSVRDTSDPLQHILYPATSGVEQISTNDDYNLYTTDSGFYFNNTNGFINSSASDVIYLAIA